MSASPLWVVSGEIGAGKTTLCDALAKRARRAGGDAAGLLSPGVFEGGQKTGIQIEDLRRGERRLLASTAPRPGFDLAFGRWHFSPSAFAWGNRVLAQSAPFDLLIVDELGPLELLHGQGFTAALAVLAARRYRLAVVVVRLALLENLRTLLPVQRVILADRSLPPVETAQHYWQETGLSTSVDRLML